MTGRHDSKDFIHQPRRDKMYEEHTQDPYHAREKWKEPTTCPDCGAIYHKGKWVWGDAAEGAHSHRCPACARIHDHVPAGFLSLKGDFLAGHKDEIMHLIKNHEQKEKAQHALERIMSIREEDGGLAIEFTGVHLTKGTGEALHHAYQGDLTVDYNDKDAQIRVQWIR